MDQNLEEKRKLNTVRAAIYRDLHNIRKSSVYQAESLDSTKKAISHNIDDCWAELKALNERQSTQAQLCNVHIAAIKADIVALAKRQEREKKGGLFKKS